MNKYKDFFFAYNLKNKKLKFFKKSNFKEIKEKKIIFFVLGKPKIDNKDFYSKFENKKKLIKKINGEFLIIVKYDKKIFVINDRFTSIPLYYVEIKDDVFFSNNYICSRGILSVLNLCSESRAVQQKKLQDPVVNNILLRIGAFISRTRKFY